MDWFQLAAALSAAIAAIASALTAIATARAAARGVTVAVPKIHLRWLLYFWPVLAVAPLAISIFWWSPATADFPELEFYRVTAEVIPLLLIAVLVEQNLVTRLPHWLRVEFIGVLLAAEAAAMIGVSEIFGSSPEVGGTSGWTGLIATTAGAGLVAGAILIVAAVLVRTP